MTYQSGESLLNRLRRLEKGGNLPGLVYFWGHTPQTGHEIGSWCLSQWWPSSFWVAGHHYATAEHFMMSEKAKLFGDENMVEEIDATEDPCRVKSLGGQVKRFDEAKWKVHRYSIVVRGNLAKFGQNPSLRDYICSTEGQVLVEASPFDTVWGIGLDARDSRAARPSEWRGSNLLGFALMDVRTALMAI